MAKSKTTEKTIHAAEGAESAMKNGAEALKTGFEGWFPLFMAGEEIPITN